MFAYNGIKLKEVQNAIGLKQLDLDILMMTGLNCL